jgi:biopolymer transport protein ExbB/TolQ
MELSIVELWRATGPVARGVVVLLGGMSLGATAVAVDKWLRLRRAERASSEFLARWRDTRTTTELVRLAAGHAASPVATLVRQLCDASATDVDTRRELHDRIVRRELLASNDQLRRGLGVLATVGSTAPFVGLFGTVVGIINAFHEIGATGHGGIDTVSTGIAEALVTTAFGIMVAIPAVWLFNHLSQRIGRQLSALETAAEDFAIQRLVERADEPARSTTGTGGPSWR